MFIFSGRAKKGIGLYRQHMHRHWG